MEKVTLQGLHTKEDHNDIKGNKNGSSYVLMNTMESHPPLEVLLSTSSSDNKNTGYVEYIHSVQDDHSTNFPFINKHAKLLGLEYTKLERFIGLVKEHPSLYDTNRPDYKDTQLLSTLWDGIANDMGISDMCGQAWKKKWRSVRDMYVRKKREIEMGKNKSTAERAKKWQFLPLFNFLNPHIEYRSESVINSDNFSSDNPSLSYNCKQQFKVENIDSTQPVSSATLQKSPKILKNNKLCKKRPLSKVGQNDQLENLLYDLISSHKKSRESFEKRLKEKIDSRSEDDDFFDGCCKRMKKLSAEKQSLLKLQITQLFFNAENPDLPDVPITSLHVANTPIYQSQFPQHQQHYQNT